VIDIYFGTAADREYAERPLTLIDVGARGGLQPNWRRARRHLRLVGFEPDASEHARLAAGADARTLYINAAVAREQGKATFNVARDPGTSSLLAPNMAFLRRFPRAERFETRQRIAVAADRLDSLLPAHGVSDPDFLKLDTQGAELAILQGAQDTVARLLLGIELEIQLAPLYIDQPSFGALDDFLRAAGFQLFDLRPSYWKRAAGALYGGPKGQLVFCDALYLRTEESFGALVGRYADADARRSKLLRMLSVALLYGYVDFAIEIFQGHRSELDTALVAAIDGQLRSDIPFSARVPHFRGRGWLSHLFYRLHRALTPTVERWASGGRHLGNMD